MRISLSLLKHSKTKRVQWSLNIKNRVLYYVCRRHHRSNPRAERLSQRRPVQAPSIFAIRVEFDRPWSADETSKKTA